MTFIHIIHVSTTLVEMTVLCQSHKEHAEAVELCSYSHPVLHSLTVGPVHFCSGNLFGSLYTTFTRVQSQIFTRNTDRRVHYSVSTSQLTMKLLTYKIYGTLN